MKNFTKLPATGPHYFSNTDIGNIYDRSDNYDYISTAFDAGSGSVFESITWKAETPFRTRVEFQVRTAVTREELLLAQWRGPKGPKSFYVNSGAKLTPSDNNHRWIQYKATLISPNSSNTPVLHSVSIEYAGDATTKSN